MNLLNILGDRIRIPTIRLTTGPMVNIEKEAVASSKNDEYIAKGKPANIAKNTATNPVARTNSFFLPRKSPTTVNPKSMDASIFGRKVSIYIEASP